MVKLDICTGICNTLNDLSNKVCIPNKTEDSTLSVSNMITGINESKTLTKFISCKRECKLDGTRCNSNQWWNNDKSWCECRKHHICEKGYVSNPSTCICKNEKYLVNIMDDSAIICGEVIDGDAKLSRKDDNDETKTISKNSNEKKATCKIQNFYILLAFLLIIIELLITVSKNWYLIKYRVKQLLPFHYSNN